VQHNIGSGGVKAIILKDKLYDYFDKNYWVMIDLETGEYEKFYFNEFAEIIINKVTGKTYLLYGEYLYW
jgi:hypothetical protein